MPWQALTVELQGAWGDAFSDALLAAGAQSVWVENTQIGALLEQGIDARALVAAAALAAGIAPPAFRVAALADEDWVRKSQAQFAPLAVGRRLWIGASWHRPEPGRASVTIDPGLAFGTGSHPSTRLVLRYLERELRGGERLLDYGCGSGILAIAAAKLGAAHVDAVDMDADAIDATRENAIANRVRVNAMLPDALPAALYDIVVANILAQPLIVLAPLLASRAERIALSGILEAQADEVARAYDAWFEIHVAEREEGWALLAGAQR